jgi:hypothetical protein
MHLFCKVLSLVIRNNDSLVFYSFSNLTLWLAPKIINRIIQLFPHRSLMRKYLQLHTLLEESNYQDGL